MHTLIQQVMSSPTTMFGIGCAAGAVTAGLIVGLVNARAKRELNMDLEEAERSLHRARYSLFYAEQSLKTTQKRLEVLERKVMAQQQQLQQQQQQRQVAPTAQVAATSTSAEPGQQSATRENVTSKRSSIPLAQRIPRIDLDDRVPYAYAQQYVQRASSGVASSAVSDTAPMPTVPKPAEQSTPPVREASQEPTKTASQVTPQAVAQPSQGTQATTLSSAARAALINSRVPRFDESLYPDIAPQVQAVDEDVFQMAMDAMEGNIATERQESAADVAVQTSAYPTNRQEPMLSEEAYVEQLVREEMDKNRQGAGRRFSRAHLTVFEGTGDLSAARKAARRSPKHLQPVSREA